MANRARKEEEMDGKHMHSKTFNDQRGTHAQMCRCGAVTALQALLISTLVASQTMSTTISRSRVCP